MSNMPISPTAPAGQEAIYGYRYVNKSTGETFMFVKNFGQGQDSAAQLIKNTATGEILVRKVWMALYRREDSKAPLRPKQPREIEILQKIQSWPDMPGVPRLFSHCYSHEFQKAKEPSLKEVGTLYRSVGLWKLCNGGAVIKNSQLAIGGTLSIRLTDEYPMAAIARFTWQIIGSLHFLGHGNPDGIPVIHRDAHLSNVFMHWSTAVANLDEPSSLLPDFILGDFGEAEFQNPDGVDSFNNSPTTDIERIQFSLRVCLEELGLLHMAKTPSGPVWHTVLGTHRPSSLKLLEINDAIDVITDEYQRTKSREYPDLMPLVEMGKEMEAMCLKGGVDADLMNSDAWEMFVTDRRAQALSASSAGPFTLRTTREQALEPFNPENGDRMELFAPWSLCLNLWKVVQDCPPPPTDPRAGKFPKTLKVEDYYSTRDSWDLLPIIEEHQDLPVQTEFKRRFFERVILGASRTDIAGDSETFTVALDNGNNDITSRWKPTPRRILPKLPGEFPNTDTESSNQGESSTGPSSSPPSLPEVSGELDEADLQSLRVDEADGVKVEPTRPKDDEDDHPKITDQSQSTPPPTEEVGQLDRVKHLEEIQSRLHQLVHDKACTCESWHFDIADKLDMMETVHDDNRLRVLSQAHSPERSTATKSSDEESPNTNKNTEGSSPPTGPDNSTSNSDANTPEDKKTSDSPRRSTPPPTVRRQPQRTTRSRLPIPISPRQIAAAAETPSRPPTAPRTITITTTTRRRTSTLLRGGPSQTNTPGTSRVPKSPTTPKGVFSSASANISTPKTPFALPRGYATNTQVRRGVPRAAERDSRVSSNNSSSRKNNSENHSLKAAKAAWR